MESKKDSLVRTISLGNGPAGGRRLVWTLATCSNGTLVSGDSSGAVTFFQATTYAQTQSIQAHLGDCLCLTVNGETVYSGGKYSTLFLDIMNMSS